MVDWFTPDDLRAAAGAVQASDQSRIELAASVARREVRRLCGPVFPVEPVTERRVRGGNNEIPLKYRPSALTSIARYVNGSALNVTEYDFDEQVLFRKDGDWITDDLVVVYDSGYDTVEEIPTELVSMATLIGQQYLRVSKRFSLNQDDPVTGIGFLVPDAAKDIGRDYLLSQGL
jgi:hypothetical protein